MALITGPAFSTSITESDVGSTTGNEPLFQDALRKGYRVSPVGDQDNHEANWGASSETRTVALGAGRTRSEILGALAAGRTTRRRTTTPRCSSARRFPMGSAFTATEGPRFAALDLPHRGDNAAQHQLVRWITGTRPELS